MGESGKREPTRSRRAAQETEEKPGFFEAFFEGNVKTTFLLWLLLITSMVLGHSYMERSVEDPAFCASCHMSEEVYISWQEQRHEDARFDCSNCHKTGIGDRNRHLFAYLAGDRGDARPREVCAAGAPWPGAPWPVAPGAGEVFAGGKAVHIAGYRPVAGHLHAMPSHIKGLN